MATPGLTGSEIYDRIYDLTIGDYRSGNGLRINSIEDEFPLQITFEVNKTSDIKHKTGNSSVIEIYNLNPDQEKLFESLYLDAQLSVGHRDGQGARLIALGNITSSSTVTRGTDTITQVQIGEGYVPLSFGRVSGNLSPGETVASVINTILASAPSLARGAITGSNLNNPVIHGWRLSGTVKEELDRITKAHGLEYNINNGIVTVTDLNKPTSRFVVDVPIINEFTGMVDKPFRITEQLRLGKKDKRIRHGVQVKTLLNPDFKVSTIVKIESDNINGYFRINSLRHTGSFRDNEWYSEIQCSEMTDADISVV